MTILVDMDDTIEQLLEAWAGFQQFEVSLECQESSIYWTLFVNFCFIFL